jgi:WD40 repeat protein/energy-coupling factor transporter ATP-binding protein EcfA2
VSRLLFLSHSGVDTEAATALKARILASPAAREHGLAVWFDKDDLRAGESWQSQLEDAIANSHAFAVYVGSGGVVNWVEAEVRLALNRAITDPDYRFVPILASAAPGPESLPGFAQQFQGVFDVEARPDEFDHLMRAILGGAEAGQLQLESEPFFGLRAIDETRSHLFFGRAKEAEALAALLYRTPLVLVTGDSGSGKSSLVRAGLAPRFRGGVLALLDGARAENTIWHVVTSQPRNQPFRQLGDAVGEAAKGLGLSLADRGALADWAAGGEIDKVRRALRCDLPPERVQVLLVVDQFEELLTITPPELRAPFIDLLLELSDPADGRHRVVLTMRHDYANLCNAFERLKNRLDADDRRARFLLGRMSEEGLRRIVTEPLRLAGIGPEDREALASEVLRDVGERPGDLALVQMALTETWRARDQHGGDLLRAYADVGRVEGALAQAAERVRTQALDDEQRAQLDSLLLRLVRLGDTGGATRRVAHREEFDDPRWRLVQKLASEDGKRLILLGGSAERPTVEIAHEALVTAWPYFQNLLQGTADDKRVLDALTPRAQAWAAQNDQSERVKRRATGADLELFAALAKRRPVWLSDDEHRFVETSLAAEQTRQLRQKWLFHGAVAASLVFLAVAIGAVWFFLEAQDQTRVAETQTRRAEAEARIAEQQTRLAEEQTRIAEERARAAKSRELAARAGDSLLLDAELGLLLALEAIDQAPTVEAEVALHRALHAARLRLRLDGRSGPVAHVAFSPDGKRVFTAISGGIAKVWDSATGKELMTLGDSGYSRTPFAVSPDGTRLVTAGRRVWNAITGAEVATMVGPKIGIPHMAFSPDGKLLATAEGDEARLWDTETWTELATLAGHTNGVEHVAFDPSGAKLVTASHDATAKIWDSSTGEELTTLEGHHETIWDVAFSPAGTQVATASHDGTVRLWDAATGEELATLRGHSDAVWDVAYDAAGTIIATASDDGTARLWDAASGQEMRTLSNHKGSVRRVAFTPDGKTLATAGADGTARLWNVATGIELVALTGHTDRVWDLALDPMGRILATASDDGTVRLWDVAVGEELVTLDDQSDGLRFVAFNPDATRLVTAGSAAAKLWNTDTWTEAAELSGHAGTINGVALSPDGRRLATGSDDGTARLWDAVTGELLANLPGHTGVIWGIAFGPNGHRLATGSFDSTAKLWDAETGAEVTTLTGHDGRIGTVAFSPDGRWLATGGDSVMVRVWDARTGAEQHVLYAHEFATFGLAFSADGTLLATAGQDGAKLWDVATGEELAFFTEHGGFVWYVAFSPDGRLLATASADDTVRLWAVPTGEERATLRGHIDSVEHVAFSPDGLRLATASADATVRLWDATTGQRLLTFSGHTGGIWHVAFSPDGAWLATASADGTAKIYPLEIDQLIARAQARLTRTLTQEECRQYLHLEKCPDPTSLPRAQLD